MATPPACLFGKLVSFRLNERALQACPDAGKAWAAASTELLFPAVPYMQAGLDLLLLVPPVRWGVQRESLSGKWGREFWPVSCLCDSCIWVVFWVPVARPLLPSGLYLHRLAMLKWSLRSLGLTLFPTVEHPFTLVPSKPSLSLWHLP